MTSVSGAFPLLIIPLSQAPPPHCIARHGAHLAMAEPTAEARGEVCGGQIYKTSRSIRHQFAESKAATTSPSRIRWAHALPADPAPPLFHAPAHPSLANIAITYAHYFHDPSATLTSHSARSPSTSPPPAPPAEEFMREGLDADDIYILVEDDFLATARLFTAHIHHAEYTRLKRQARSRRAGAMPERPRPVDARPPASPQAKAMRAQSAERKKTEQAQRPDVTAKEPKEKKASAGMEDLWKGSELHGLLTGQSQAPQPLKIPRGAPPKTRAAAGFSRRDKTAEARRRTYDLEPGDAPRAEGAWASKAPVRHRRGSSKQDTDDDSGDDDLDGPATRRTGTATIGGRAASKASLKAGAKLQSSSTQPSTSRRKAVAFAAETVVHESSALEEAREPDRGDVLDDLARPTPLPSGRSWARKRHDIVRETEAGERKKIEEIPIFLV